MGRTGNGWTVRIPPEPSPSPTSAPVEYYLPADVVERIAAHLDVDTRRALSLPPRRLRLEPRMALLLATVPPKRTLRFDRDMDDPVYVTTVSLAIPGSSRAGMLVYSTMTGDYCSFFT